MHNSHLVLQDIKDTNTDLIGFIWYKTRVNGQRPCGMVTGQEMGDS